MIDHEGETLSQKLLKRGFWLYLFTFLAGPVAYATKITVSSTLSVESVGLLYGIVSLVTIAGTYNDFGISESLHYFLPKAIAARDWGRFKALLIWAFGVQTMIGIAIAGAFFFGADWLAIHHFKDPAAAQILRVFCLFFLGINAYQLLQAVFAAAQDTFSQKGVELVRGIGLFGFVLVLWIGGETTLAHYAWAWIVGLTIGLGGSLWIFCTSSRYAPYLRGVAPRFESGFFHETVSYALVILFTQNLTVLLSQVDMQIILRELGKTAAGYYTNYLSLITIPFLFVTPLTQFLLPVIAHEGEGSSRIAHIKALYYGPLAFLAISFSSLLCIAGQPLAVAFFGERFMESGIIMAFSAPFLVFNFLLQINLQILSGTGNPKKRLLVPLSGLVINILLCYATIWYTNLGVRGIALAVGSTWVFLFLLAHFLTRQVPSGVSWRLLGRNILATLVAALVSLGILNALYTMLARHASPGASFPSVFEAAMSVIPAWIDRLAGLGFVAIVAMVHIIAALLANWEAVMAGCRNLKHRFTTP